MTEELAKEQVFDKRGAIDLDQRTVLSRAEAMDGLGDKLLPSTGFALEQHRRLAVGHAVDDAENLMNTLVFTDNFRIAGAPATERLTLEVDFARLR